MRIMVFNVGRSSKGPERELTERYAKRIKPLAKARGFGACTLHFIPESRKSSAIARRGEEAEKLLKLFPDSALIALDEKGKNLSSSAFSVMMQKFRGEGRGTIAFVIGGPDGLDPRLVERADFVLAFGAMTWPHQLSCAMLMEQIYRGLTLLSGHPYHRQ